MTWVHWMRRTRNCSRLLLGFWVGGVPNILGSHETVLNISHPCSLSHRRAVRAARVLERRAARRTSGRTSGSLGRPSSTTKAWRSTCRRPCSVRARRRLPPLPGRLRLCLTMTRLPLSPSGPLSGKLLLEATASLQTGHTFDRASLEKRLGGGPLGAGWVPNWVVRRLVHDWCLCVGLEPPPASFPASFAPGATPAGGVTAAPEAGSGSGPGSSNSDSSDEEDFAPPPNPAAVRMSTSPPLAPCPPHFFCGGSVPRLIGPLALRQGLFVLLS